MFFVLRGRSEEGNDILDPRYYNSVPGETYSDDESPRTPPPPQEESFLGGTKHPEFYPAHPRKPKPGLEVGASWGAEVRE